MADSQNYVFNVLNQGLKVILVALKGKTSKQKIIKHHTLLLQVSE